MNKPNLAKMKQQLESIKNPKASSTSTENSYFWKLEEGMHQIRLLSLPNGDIMKDFHFHYGVNGKNYVCAKKSFHKECPICELASNIWKEYEDGNRSDDSLKEMAKELFASKRFYFPILVRGLESEGPKVYSCGSRAAEQIMQIALDPDNEDMFDTQNGFDLKISYNLAVPNDKRSAQTTITASRKPSPLLAGASPNDLESLFASIPDFDNLFEMPDVDSIRNDLDSFISGLDSSINDSVGTTKFESAEKNPVLDALRAFESD